MRSRKLRPNKKYGKAKKLATKHWLAGIRKNQVVGDTIKLTCYGEKELVRITGPKGTGMVLATPVAIERVKQEYPDLEIQEATAEELTNWVNEQLKQQHYQGDAVVDEIKRFCVDNLVGEAN